MPNQFCLANGGFRHLFRSVRDICQVWVCAGLNGDAIAASGNIDAAICIVGKRRDAGGSQSQDEQENDKEIFNELHKRTPPLRGKKRAAETPPPFRLLV